MKKSKKFKFPSSMVTLLFFLIIVSLLTYIIPAGKFNAQTNPDTGKETVTLDDFEFTENTPVNLFELPFYIVKAFASGSTVTIVITYLFIGGCINILTGCGALQALANAAIRKLKGKRFLVLCSYALIFTLMGLTLTPHAYVAFVPFSITFASSLGYDAIVGVSLPMLGSAVSYCPGALMATTVTAQSMIGLSPYTGLAYRLLCTVILFFPTILYIYFYGEKVRTGRQKSIVPEYRYEHAEICGEQTVSGKHIFTAIAFLLMIAVIVYGSSKYKWTTLELSACFLVYGLMIGLLYYHNPETVIDMYIKGAQNMLPGAAIAGVASAIAIILSSGGIMYTVVYYASRVIQSTGSFFKPIALFLAQSVINIAIVSGGGQIAATMHIIGPISQISGISAQTTVLCTTLGDGLGNYVLPHSSSLAGFIGAGRIEYGEWMKFMWKLFLIWMLISCMLVSISTLVWT